MNSTAGSKIIRFPLYRALSRKDGEWQVPYPDRGPQPVKLLIGDLPAAGIGKAVVDYLETKFQERYRLRVRMTDSGIKLIGLASYCDIYLAVINNVWWAPDGSGENRLAKSLIFNRYLMRKCRKPVIGLTSITREPFLSEAKASVDYFFVMPTRLTNIGTAFERALVVRNFPTGGYYG